jgi:chromosomal replication initiation ATPase DnaA
MTKDAAEELIKGMFNRKWSREELIEIVMSIDADTEKKLDELLTVASYVTELSKDEIMEKNRKGDRPLARSLCYKYLRDCGYTYHYIGKMFQGRNHATILHSLRTLKNDLDTNFKPTVEAFNRFNSIINA